MKNVLFLVGATAVGKSAVALRLAEQTGASILVMDAMQVYTGLNIGVSKPTPQEQARVRHGGINLVPWTERFDVARYVAAAADFLRKTTTPVIICGGTGLYFRALTQGLCEAPAAPPVLREELAQLSVEALQVRLQRVDPEIFAQVDQNNPRRLQRAIEVMEFTGRSLRAWQAESTPALITAWKAVWLDLPRPELRARIRQRTEEMLAQGWCEEVQSLCDLEGEEKLAQCPAIGYKELMQVNANRLTLAEATEAIVVQTAQYAKRQVTWFQREAGLCQLAANPDSILAHWSADI